MRFALGLAPVAAGVLLLAIALAESRRDVAPEPRRPHKFGVDLFIGGVGSAPRLPKAARLEPSGYATILSAPPSRYDPREAESPPAAEPTTGVGHPFGPGVSRLIRVFARMKPMPADDGQTVRTLEMPPIQDATLILRDGCLRLAGTGEPLIGLGPAAQLFVAADGYLTLRSIGGPVDYHARVGERIWWQGAAQSVTDQRIVEPLRRRCGPGKVQLVPMPASVSVGELYT